MEPWVQQIAVPLAVAVLTSSGLWALIGKRRDKNDVERKMLVGLAHDRIIHLGMTYIQRGEVTQEMLPATCSMYGQPQMLPRPTYRALSAGSTIMTTHFKTS